MALLLLLLAAVFNISYANNNTKETRRDFLENYDIKNKWDLTNEKEFNTKTTTVSRGYQDIMGCNLHITANIENVTEIVIIEENVRDMFYYKVGVAIQRYWLPIIVPFGLVGNTLTLFVMSNKTNRYISFCIYLMALAVADNIVLMLAICFWIGGEDIHQYQNTECKLIVYLCRVFVTCGTFLVVAMTTDRYRAISYPHHSPLLAKRAKIISVIILIIICIYTIPHYIYSHPIDGGRFCAAFADPEMEHIFQLVYSFINSIVNVVIPFTIIIVLNILILFKHKQRSLKLNQKTITTCTTHHNHKFAARDRQLVVILLLVSFTGLILSMPQYIRYTMFLFVDYKKDVDSIAKYVLVYNITNKLYFTNNAINFILYCLSGPKFRSDLVRMVKYRCKSAPVNISHVNSNFT